MRYSISGSDEKFEFDLREDAFNIEAQIKMLKNLFANRYSRYHLPGGYL